MRRSRSRSLHALAARQKLLHCPARIHEPTQAGVAPLPRRGLVPAALPELRPPPRLLFGELLTLHNRCDTLGRMRGLQSQCLPAPLVASSSTCCTPFRATLLRLRSPHLPAFGLLATRLPPKPSTLSDGFSLGTAELLAPGIAASGFALRERDLHDLCPGIAQVQPTRCSSFIEFVHLLQNAEDIRAEACADTTANHRIRRCNATE
mmetsp:Transcript_163150/g.523171  ORF Transcript_163150/g.523171 Transcript_163150/m.523171 type:complete len:206 (-) Transcript_163150:1495-2112(-)